VLPVQIKILNQAVGKTIPLPEYATSGSAGLDLRVCIDAQKELLPNQTYLFPTGIAIYLKDPAWVGIIVPRSGLGHKAGIVLGNLTGVIDSDYQGEIKLSIWNRSMERFVVEPGDRLAQLVVMPVAQMQLEVVEQFQSTQRGSDGFGSSGTQ
jgi:dUTP pyrophosphatase